MENGKMLIRCYSAAAKQQPVSPLLDGIRNYLVWPAQSGKLHFWIAKDCSCPMRCGRTSVTGTTHIIKFFLKFSSIKQTWSSSEN